MTKLPGEVFQPGVVRLSGNGFEIVMKYNPDLLVATIENIKIEDQKLIHNVGNEVNRLVFEFKNQSLKGDLTFEVTQIK